MTAQLLATAATVLDRRASGDAWLRVSVLSAEHGIIDCLQRLARRTAGKAPPLDLFDDAQLSLESRNAGRTWFVREVDLTRRRAGLAGSLAALRAACRLARVLVQNPVPEESRTAVFELLQRALDAWETGLRPDAIYFKSLYVLARDEGYPVREAWWRRLRAADRDAAQSILRQPAAEQTVAPEEVSRLTDALEEYLRTEADFRIE